MYEQKEGDISIFRNDKQGKESRPDWTGSVLIDGKKRSISLWEKKGAKGMFLAGKAQNLRNPGDAVETDAPKEKITSKAVYQPYDEDDSQIPF